jgi:hypothetical protein
MRHTDISPYRTQEVAGSSPASSIREHPARDQFSTVAPSSHATAHLLTFYRCGEAIERRTVPALRQTTLLGRAGAARSHGGESSSRG